MVAGGTGGDHDYKGIITSYDYDTAISEAGDYGQPGIGGPNKFEVGCSSLHRASRMTCRPASCHAMPGSTSLARFGMPERVPCSMSEQSFGEDGLCLSTLQTLS